MIFFLLLHENIWYVYTLELPQWGNSNEYSYCMFSWKNKKNINTLYFLVENQNSMEGGIAPARAKVTGATIRMWLLNKFISYLAEKTTKIKTRIIWKADAHLQTMEKTCAKFQKDWYKIVWGVVLTRYPLFIYWGWKMTKFTMWKKSEVKQMTKLKWKKWQK